jgi:hypothetical protein
MGLFLASSVETAFHRDDLREVHNVIDEGIPQKGMARSQFNDIPIPKKKLLSSPKQLRKEPQRGSPPLMHLDRGRRVRIKLLL